MSDLSSKIAALPPWPTPDGHGDGFELVHCAVRLGAALARLALAREWIEGRPHDGSCPAIHGAPNCFCGRDALLKALEVPR